MGVAASWLGDSATKLSCFGRRTVRESFHGARLRTCYPVISVGIQDAISTPEKYKSEMATRLSGSVNAVKFVEVGEYGGQPTC
jgi:hypothetical protein